MANLNTSTLDAPSKAVSVFSHTLISHNFSHLLGELAVLIEEERDIEHVDVFDPAFSGWLKDAELAHEAVTSRLLSVLESPIQRDEDRALQRVAFGLHALMQSEELGEFTRIYNVLQSFPAAFICAGPSAVARRVTVMLTSMRLRMDDLTSLTAYSDEFDIAPEPEVLDSAVFILEPV